MYMRLSSSLSIEIKTWWDLVGPGEPWWALVGPGEPWWALVGPGEPWWALESLVGTKKCTITFQTHHHHHLAELGDNDFWCTAKRRSSLPQAALK